MGLYISKEFRNFFKKKILINKSKVLVIGLTFKENVPDTRNSQSIKMIRLLNQFDLKYILMIQLKT